jgi:hypothetical protein
MIFIVILLAKSDGGYDNGCSSERKMKELLSA